MITLKSIFVVLVIFSVIFNSFLLSVGFVNLRESIIHACEERFSEEAILASNPNELYSFRCSLPKATFYSIVDFLDYIFLEQ